MHPNFVKRQLFCLLHKNFLLVIYHDENFVEVIDYYDDANISLIGCQWYHLRKFIENWLLWLAQQHKLVLEALNLLSLSSSTFDIIWLVCTCSCIGNRLHLNLRCMDYQKFPLTFNGRILNSNLSIQLMKMENLVLQLCWTCKYLFLLSQHKN